MPMGSDSSTECGQSPSGGSGEIPTVKGFLLYSHLQANQRAKKTKTKQTKKPNKKQNFENSFSITYVVNRLYYYRKKF